MKRLMACLLLAACSGQPLTKPIPVSVPVSMPCQPPVVTHPVWPTLELSVKSTFLDHVKALIAENELRQAYEVQLVAALKACE